MLAEHKKVLHEFDIMSDAASAYATTFAGITASAFVTPFLRNHVASRFQNASLKYMETSTNIDTANQNINFKSHYNRIKSAYPIFNISR